MGTVFYLATMFDVLIMRLRAKIVQIAVLTISFRILCHCFHD